MPRKDGRNVRVAFGVLGPVTAWDAAADAIALKGPRHRAVLARLIIARGRVVPVAGLVEDLWDDPPPGAIGAVRTFVAALRRGLEPERPPRTPARLLVTQGPGYALHAEPDAVDAWRFEQVVAATASLPPGDGLARLDEALGWWRGPAYADFADEAWASPERSRLAELRLHAVERQAETRLALGLAAQAVPDLDAHVTAHPWREEAWRLLALALYRSGRQGDALAVLRRARAQLAGQLGVDPGLRLRRLETDILRHASHLDPTARADETADEANRAEEANRAAGADEAVARSARADEAADGANRAEGAAVGANRADEADRTDGTGGVADRPDRAAAEPGEPGGSGGSGGSAARIWAQTAAVYDRTVASGARARLESAVGLLSNLAVTGGAGLEAARQHRLAAIAAAEELGDAELTAQVIGGYDVPAIWTRSDDPQQAAQVVAAAERALAALPAGGHNATRARLLATIALESRGTSSARGPQAASQAEDIARRLDDPALLAFSLNGVFMQTFQRAGLAPRRDQIGAELVALSARHGLVTFEVLGHLIRLQARSALADFPGADQHAAAIDRLAERHELPLAGVFTQWYQALRLATTNQAATTSQARAAGQVPPTSQVPAVGQASVAQIEAAYAGAAARLQGAGMPGLENGLLPLALLCLRLSHAQPARADEHTDWGPYQPWVHPLVLLAQDRTGEAAAALRNVPDPPRDLLFEALWCLIARTAIAVGDAETMRRARAELSPAAAELSGAGSGLLTLGPVSRYLCDLDQALEACASD